MVKLANNQLNQYTVPYSSGFLLHFSNFFFADSNRLFFRFSLTHVVFLNKTKTQFDQSANRLEHTFSFYENLQMFFGEHKNFA